MSTETNEDYAVVYIEKTAKPLDQIKIPQFKVPKSYKKPDTIAKWLEEKRQAYIDNAGDQLATSVLTAVATVLKGETKVHRGTEVELLGIINKFTTEAHKQKVFSIVFSDLAQVAYLHKKALLLGTYLHSQRMYGVTDLWNHSGVFGNDTFEEICEIAEIPAPTSTDPVEQVAHVCELAKRLYRPS